jgi:hypothetical protein
MALRFVEIDGEQFVEHDGPLESWWLDTPFGCGWVATRNGRIIAGAPIFFRMSGWDLHRCPKHYKYHKLCDETEEQLACWLATNTYPNKNVLLCCKTKQRPVPRPSNTAGQNKRRRALTTGKQCGHGTRPPEISSVKRLQD